MSLPHDDGLPDGSGWGLWLSLADVKGISTDEIVRIVSGQPYASLADFWARARIDAPVVERLILAGGFDRLYRIQSGSGPGGGVRRPGQITRRDLLLSLADLKRLAMVEARTARRARGLTRQPVAAVSDDPRDLARRQAVARPEPSHAADRRVAMPLTLFDVDQSSEMEDPSTDPERAERVEGRFTRSEVVRRDAVPTDVQPTGLPEMTDTERLTAELDILGLDASRHIVEFYRDFLAELGTVDSADLLRHRNQSEVLIAGVKVATQTPPVRSGRRVIFLTLDDATGPSDATFFEDVQGPYAATVFGSWLLVVRGLIRRTGPRGISLRATGAWDLQHLHGIWRAELAATGDRAAAMAAVRRELDVVPIGYNIVGEPLEPIRPAPAGTVGHSDAAPAEFDPSLPVGDREGARTPGAPPFQYADWVPGGPREGAGYGAGRGGVRGGAASEASETDTHPDTHPDTGHQTRAGGMGRRRVLVHASGFKQSPYADVKPSGASTQQAPPTSVVPPASPPAARPPAVPPPMVEPPSLDAPRKLWHSSPGSSGR